MRSRDVTSHACRECSFRPPLPVLRGRQRFPSAAGTQRRPLFLRAVRAYCVPARVDLCLRLRALYPLEHCSAPRKPPRAVSSGVATSRRRYRHQPQERSSASLTTKRSYAAKKALLENSGYSVPGWMPWSARVAKVKALVKASHPAAGQRAPGANSVRAKPRSA